MNDFILVTNRETVCNCCIAIKAILTIDELEDGTAYITLNKFVNSNLKKSGSFGVYTIESFESILKKLFGQNGIIEFKVKKIAEQQ